MTDSPKILPSAREWIATFDLPAKFPDARRVPPKATRPAPLAPLQRVMLGDSLAAPACGHHVEQLEIRFTAGTSSDHLAVAWARTVAETTALQVGFRMVNGQPTGLIPTVARETLEILPGEPISFATWAENDRRRPLLIPAKSRGAPFTGRSPGSLFGRSTMHCSTAGRLPACWRDSSSAWREIPRAC